MVEARLACTHPRTAHRQLFVTMWAWLLPLIVATPATGFVAGAICDGVNLSTAPAHTLLHGKHLVIREAVWSPFAFKDATNRVHGWDGMNMELIALVAAELKFTYEILEMRPLPTETVWTPMLFREADRGDLIMSYWLQTAERMDKVVMLGTGHVDMSPVLVAREESFVQPSIFQDPSQLLSFMRPFSLELWLCLVLMILCSGLVDWALERRKSTSATVGASLYEYVAGTLWGGFEYPRSKQSGVYQITTAFVLLVTISTRRISQPS